jgi:uncharacterized membrane protein YraQ (UPF0718 family)
MEQISANVVIATGVIAVLGGVIMNLMIKRYRNKNVEISQTAAPSATTNAATKPSFKTVVPSKELKLTEYDYVIDVRG